MNKKYKSYAKINLFLKIVGIRGNYHEIFSRFIRVHSLYDILSFEKSEQNSFFIDSEFSFPQEKNIIHKTYLSLLSYLNKSQKQEVEKFFQNYSLKVTKNIPMMAGLGGGSSNSATFLNMVDEVLNINLTLNQKIKIVDKLGSDIIFFLYNINSANVFGTGNIIEIFDEEKLDIEIVTPKIECDTSEVYKIFRKKFYHISDIKDLDYLKLQKSKDIFSDISLDFANDLFQPAKYICPKLEKMTKDNYLFSGSGSSFFTIRS
jgi:4-diphosphocytidyl-2-C-methyl-D-erythritol kinase